MFLFKNYSFFKYFFPKGIIWDVPNKENKIFLTFDDGPHPEITSKVLEILDKYKIKATFFLVGNNVSKYPETFEKIKNSGHSVGIHTYQHVKASNVTFENYINEIEKTKQLVNSDLFRPPHGLISRKWAKEILKKYKIVLWTVLSGDFSPKLSQDKCLKALNKYTKSGNIIVFHDSIKAAPRMLPILEVYIQSCINKGFVFDKL